MHLPSKIERKRQISYDITYMHNPKTEQKQKLGSWRQKMDWLLPEAGEGRGEVEEKGKKKEKKKKKDTFIQE